MAQADAAVVHGHQFAGVHREAVPGKGLDQGFKQQSVLQAVVENGLNVRQTEALIVSLSTETAPEETAVGRKRIKVIRDVRIFLNTIKKVVGDLKGTGVKVKVKQDLEGNDIVLTMRIPTKPAAKKAKKV